MWNEICPHSRSEYFTRRRRISHFAVIFHLPARANFVEKSTLARAFFWWERVDSDHRSHRQQIYSLPPLATRERSHMELVNGVEPSTCWLQISCSAIEPHQHFYPPPPTATALAVALPLRRVLVYHKDFLLSRAFSNFFDKNSTTLSNGKAYERIGWYP